MIVIGAIIGWTAARLWLRIGTSAPTTRLSIWLKQWRNRADLRRLRGR